MLQSTHYNLNLAEGTDLVNPLTIDVPNYQNIDNIMFANEQAGVGTATELKSGTIHAITRANTNRNVFKFKSTSIFLAGDTFTVDGSTVTALYPDGSSLKERCFIVGSEVLCLLDGSQLTVLTNYIQSATDVPFDDTNVSYTANNVQTAIENASTASGTEYSSGVSVKNKIDGITKLSIAANQYTSYQLAFGALETAFDALTSDEKKKAFLVVGDDQIYHISEISSKSFTRNGFITDVQCTLVMISLYASKNFRVCRINTNGTISITDNVTNAQTNSLKLVVGC